jgi:NitT/TauT family transport system permease protein
MTIAPRSLRRRSRRTSAEHRAKITGLHLAFIAALMGMWQYASGHWINPLLVASPWAILVRLWAWLTDGILLHNLEPTVEALLLGFFFGSVLAFIVAVFFAEVRPLGNFFESYILALGAVPFVAIAPLLIVWFGIGLEPKVVVSALTTFCAFFANAYTGLCETDPNLLELGRILRASRWQRLTKFHLWAAMPYLISGVKQALPRAVFATIVIEFLASSRGIGYLITQSGNNLDMPGLFTSVLVLVILSQGLIALVRLAERRLLFWQPQERR